MKLEEAIRVNTVLMGAPVLKDDPIIIAALKLDNEALKCIERCPRWSTLVCHDLLPGETID